MPNPLTVTVNSPNRVLDAGEYGAGALVRIQSSTTSGGVYGDLAGIGSTPTINVVANTYSYPGEDPGGSATTWYRTRYENVGGTRLSSWSYPFQTGGLICDLDDVRQRLDILETDTSLDEQLIGYIRQAGSFIQNKARRQFLPVTGTYYFNGDNTNSLIIPKGVRAVTSIGYALTDQPNNGTGTYSTITATKVYLWPPEYERLEEPAYVLRLGSTAEIGYWPAGYFTVQAVLDTGFAEPPQDIQQVAQNLVVAAHRARAASGYETFTASIGGERTFERMLSAMDYNTIMSYRHQLVA